MRTCDTVAKCHLPPLTLCHRGTLKDDRVTTLYTLWTKPPVTIARNLSVHAHFLLSMLMVPKSEAEILNILKLPSDAQGNGQSATDSQVCKQASDSDPRTRTFQQTRPTMGDTTSSVKGIIVPTFILNFGKF